MSKRRRSAPVLLKTLRCILNVCHPVFLSTQPKHSEAHGQHKVYGPDPNLNPQLANVVAAAKKAGVPKEKIDGAIARGQGRSSTGAMLESMTFEALLPPSVALIVDVETDNKSRSLQDLNVIIKGAKGTASATKFFFTRVGRVVFEKGDSRLDVDSIMDDAIEAGAQDLENDADGNIVVWTLPNGTTQICQALGRKFGLKVISSDIIWSANKDIEAQIESPEDLERFTTLLSSIRSCPDVSAVYSNVSRRGMTDEEWARIAENLDV